MHFFRRFSRSFVRYENFYFRHRGQILHEKLLFELLFGRGHGFYTFFFRTERQLTLVKFSKKGAGV